MLDPLPRAAGTSPTLKVGEEMCRRLPLRHGTKEMPRRGLGSRILLNPEAVHQHSFQQLYLHQLSGRRQN